MMHCEDCNGLIEDEDIVYGSLDAYDDDPDRFCPFCGSDHVVDVQDNGDKHGG